MQLVGFQVPAVEVYCCKQTCTLYPVAEMASIIEYILCEALKSCSLELDSALEYAAALKCSAFKDVQ